MYPTFYVDRDWVSHQEAPPDPWAPVLTVGFYILATTEILFMICLLIGTLRWR